MHRIIDRRGTGKTRKLLEYAKDHKANVICKNPNIMEQKAINYGIIGLNFISYNDFLNTTISSESLCVIDEMEEFIKYKCPTLVGYTLSKEDEIKNIGQYIEWTNNSSSYKI